MNKKQAKSLRAYGALGAVILVGVIAFVLATEPITQSVGDSDVSANFVLITEPLAGRAYTPYPFTEAHLTYCITPSGNSITAPFPVTDQDISYLLNHAKDSDPSLIKEMGIDYLTSETYLEDVAIMGTCDDYKINEETGANESYSYECTIGTNQEERTRPAWEPLSSSSHPDLEKGEQQCFDIWAKIQPSLNNPLAVDVIPTVTLSGRDFAFSEAAWWNGAWIRRKEINITGGSINLTNFTVYLALSKEVEMQDDYDDLRFLNATNGTELDYDLDWYNSSEAGVWLRFPLLVMGNNSVYMYYGNNNSGVGEDVMNAWDDGFLEVYHFNNGSNDVYDELNNNTPACRIGKNGTWSTRTEYAWNFGNTSLYIDGSSGTTNGTFVSCGNHPGSQHNFTITIWADLQSVAGSTASIYEWSQGWTTYIFQKWTDEKNLRVRNLVSTGYSALTDLSAFGNGAFQQYVGLVNSTNNAFYHNGSVVSMAGISTMGTYDSGFPKLLFKYHNQPGAKGYITEMRYDLEPRTSEWIVRDWQNRNASYVWFGSEEASGAYATEGEGDQAIKDGLALSNINYSNSNFTEQELYGRTTTNAQNHGKFDYVVVSGNQTWAFNYVTAGDATSSFTNMSNMSDLQPLLYVWENQSKTAGEITTDVKQFIDSTNQSI